ncbi:MAG: transglycosylase SLT domain-containing protein [Proteobacteria bacterium]|nr:transglycosylase SLT domain-containing protein [Pseudomonadota bacterium]
MTGYVKMRYFEETNNLDSALFYANEFEAESDDTLFYDIVRVYKKTHNDSFILKYAELRNDSLIKLFYFVDHNVKDSVRVYTDALPDTSFYKMYKLILKGGKSGNIKDEIQRLNYDSRVYVYEKLSMYRKAISLRKKLLTFRGIENIYMLAKDCYIVRDKERAYYYFKFIVNRFPDSEYALKSLYYLRKDRKIHGKLRYKASQIYIAFGRYRSALSVISPLSRYSWGNRKIRAVCYYHLKRYRSAIRLLWRKRNSHTSEASFYIGLSYYKMKKYKKAKRFLMYYIKYCHNREKHVGEAYYRMAQMDDKRKIRYYRITLGYDIPIYFKERALFAIYETGDTTLFQDIINQFVSQTGILTPKMAYTLTNMSKALNNKGLAIYYREYLKQRYPANYYAVEEDSNNFDNVYPIKNANLLKPLEIGITSGYQSVVKKILKESKNGGYYLPLAKYACKSGNYPLSINFAKKYLNDCIKTGWAINDSLYYFLFPPGYASVVRDASAEYGVDKSLIYAIIREESWFQRRAVSRMGAIGVMQILPSTFRHLKRFNRKRYFDLDYNIDAGTFYISELMRKYNGNVLQVIAHYNGGSFPANGGGNVDFIEHIPYVETERYVKNVMRSYEIYKVLYGSD